MNTVLVSGGAGYIGSQTVSELIPLGIPVIVLDNLSTGHREAVRSPYFYEGDIADRDLVDYVIRKHEIKSLIHFAAKSQVAESILCPETYFSENTAKSFVFLETAVKAGVCNLVFSSTAAVYGIPDRCPISEDARLAPINPYGASKRMIEEYLQWVGSLRKVNWMSLRYFNAAGAAIDGSLGEDHRPETHLIPLVMQAMLQGTELSVFGTDYDTPDGTCIRDYVHVSDLAQAHILALQALQEGQPSQSFNVGTGQGFSVREVVEESQKVSGQRLGLKYESRREGDPPVLVADNSRLIKMGWKAKFSELPTLLSTAWNWHKNHPWGY
ncbi:MAG: UDP-glucose 4-epimerase GalE [Syntrophomonas sp.]